VVEHTPPSADTVLRAMSDDGAFRVIVARTTHLVSRAIETQSTPTPLLAPLAKQFGELLTGAVLVRETMAPGQRLQALLHYGQRGGRLVADSYPNGDTRGLVANVKDPANATLRDGTLELMRTMYHGELHRGMVQVPEGGGVSQALMAYLKESEQVDSMLSVACEMDERGVVVAGGYLVQLLPEVERGPLMVMTMRLEDFTDIGPMLLKTNADPQALLDELLYAMPYTTLEARPIQYKCQCSLVRVMSSLATIGRDDLTSMIQDGQTLDIQCDYCGVAYAISPSQLHGLLELS
jgi:molecular chaperone Hsp33